MYRTLSSQVQQNGFLFYHPLKKEKSNPLGLDVTLVPSPPSARTNIHCSLQPPKEGELSGGCFDRWLLCCLSPLPQRDNDWRQWSSNKSYAEHTTTDEQWSCDTAPTAPHNGPMPKQHPTLPKLLVLNHFLYSGKITKALLVLLAF